MRIDFSFSFVFFGLLHVYVNLHVMEAIKIYILYNDKHYVYVFFI